jgi:hypothetical protein
VGYIPSVKYIPHFLILWDMRTELTRLHEKALMLLFAELESTAAEQRDAFLVGCAVIENLARTGSTQSESP